MQDPAVIGELKKFKLTANYASAGEVLKRSYWLREVDSVK